MNTEPQTNESLPVKNINIVTWGGKKIGEGHYIEDPPLILKVASPKKVYQPECQMQYYQEVAKLFEVMTKEKGK